MRELNNF